VATCTLRWRPDPGRGPGAWGLDPGLSAPGGPVPGVARNHERWISRHASGKICPIQAYRHRAA